MMRLPSALPTLAGNRLKTFRITWLGLFTLALMGVTAGAWSLFTTTRQIDGAIYGAGIRVVPQGTRFTVEAVAPEVAAGSIEAGSTLVAIDGRPVSNRNTRVSYRLLADTLEGPDGSIKRLTVRLPDGHVETIAIARGPQYLAAADRAAPLDYAGRQALNVASYVVINLAQLAAAALLFRRRASDSVVALLSTGLILMAAGDVVYLTAPSVLGDNVTNLVSDLASMSIFVAITTFPTGQFNPRWSLLVLTLAAERPH